MNRCARLWGDERGLGVGFGVGYSSEQGGRQPDAFQADRRAFGIGYECFGGLGRDGVQVGCTEKLRECWPYGPKLKPTGDA